MGGETFTEGDAHRKRDTKTCTRREIHRERNTRIKRCTQRDTGTHTLRKGCAHTMR